MGAKYHLKVAKNKINKAEISPLLVLSVSIVLSVPLISLGGLLV
jgi:hypothetical protein